MRAPDEAPGPKWFESLSHLNAIRRDPVHFGTSLIEKFGDVVQFRFGPVRAFLLAHPDDYEHVLQKNFSNYRKGFGFKKLSAIMGEGLTSSEEKIWRPHRKHCRGMRQARWMPQSSIHAPCGHRRCAG